MANFLKNRFFWVCIEGVDAVGKTMLFKKIVKRLEKKYNNYQVILLNEFSNFKTGKLIKQEINKNFFFSLKEGVNYPIAETLLLESDFVLQFENIFNKKAKRKKIIISDRGPLTFFIYQKLRLNKKYRNIKWDSWIKNCLSDIISEPDLYIILDCKIEEIKQRIFKRDGKLLKNKEVIKIKQYQKEYKKFVGKKNIIFIKNSIININSILQYIEKEIEKAFYKKTP